VRRGRLSAFVLVAVLVGFAGLPAGIGAAGPVSILHAPPTEAVPGTQVYLTALLLNATSATLSWRNATMAADALVPMTNLSRAAGAGWVFAAYIPAQPSPTPVSYTITAQGPSGSASASFAFAVDLPTASGLTEADQAAWVLTLASALSTAVSTITLLYWYTGRRLRRAGA